VWHSFLGTKFYFSNSIIIISNGLYHKEQKEHGLLNKVKKRKIKKIKKRKRKKKKKTMNKFSTSPEISRYLPFFVSAEKRITCFSCLHSLVFLINNNNNNIICLPTKKETAKCHYQGHRPSFGKAIWTTNFFFGMFSNNRK
jgi:hypothetical protein